MAAVGSLDFAAKDEDLRVFFESLLTTERGPVPSSEDGVAKTWVTHVRVVRDPGTQLGKGFAYVEFTVRAVHLFCSLRDSDGCRTGNASTRCSRWSKRA